MASGASATPGAGPSSAATAARDNLPEPLTRFIGREGVVEELQGLLARINSVRDQMGLQPLKLILEMLPDMDNNKPK